MGDLAANVNLKLHESRAKVLSATKEYEGRDMYSIHSALHQIVNRVLFNNCGLSGDQFAMVLEGLAYLRDFKSIIYKMNAVNSLSLEKMIPVLDKRLPMHLEELKLIDCKINSS